MQMNQRENPFFMHTSKGLLRFYWHNANTHPQRAPAGRFRVFRERAAQPTFASTTMAPKHSKTQTEATGKPVINNSSQSSGIFTSPDLATKD
jgi:hypothetical protein